MDRRTNTHTQIHPSAIVTTLSHLLLAGSEIPNKGINTFSAKEKNRHDIFETMMFIDSNEKKNE